MRLAVLGVFEQHTVHVAARILEEALRAVEDDQRNVAVTKHAQLVSLLHQPELALGESYLHHSGGDRVGALKDGVPKGLQLELLCFSFHLNLGNFSVFANLPKCPVPF